ncbi:uncharacterized protein DFL_005453 [Arthrobotrys flagrans]|uniref:NADP-dependent oxidoreductase domain-containing protein n=1 Tax=Arthrobotrys flagrans TaxID=97331 RepID=A0A436ZXG3_ARTFL|nr:hypothetical protein DFL_005453 [Arthrobotrys flagrans]
MAQSKTQLPVILGTMTFGENSRITDPEECKRLIEIFKSYGHTELDTARVYNSGTSEIYLGKIGTSGLTVATKLYPTAKPGVNNPTATNHTPECINKEVSISLTSLNLQSIDLWYLHAPDHTTDITITLPAVNDLFTSNKIKALGISNYKSWEVARICEISKAKGYQLPKVYQGVYNVIHREVEPELFSVLRHYGISFYAYNPLAGGFFTATGPKSVDEDVESGTRFDNTKIQGQMYRARYWKESYFTARSIIEEVANKHGLTLVEVALRWINHHSLMKKENEDKVIIGASSEKHLRENCEDLEKGPLPEEVVEVCAKAWAVVKPDCETYWR